MNKDVSTLTFQGETGRDEFQREQIADKVITLLTSDIDVSPMVIDGNWGTGKTEFCHKLINKFKKSHPNYHILYVDAFQADHADDPLMTILAEVLNILPEGDKKEGLISKAMPVLRYGFKTALKAGANHILRANSDDIADGLDKYIQDAADTAIDASVMAVLKDHEKAKENLEALQQILGELAKEKPIIIFIDELDRCRPDFSVQMLEVIKHTFDVEGVQFVLVTNTTQLKAAINHRYGGTSIDAKRYLDKFLKFSFCLPDFVPRSGYSRNKTLSSITHFDNQVSKSTILQNTEFNNRNYQVNNFVDTLITINKLSLREVEAFVRSIEIFYKLGNSIGTSMYSGESFLRIFGIFIFCFESDIEESIRSSKTDAVQITKLLGINPKPESHVERYELSDVGIIAIILGSACSKKEYFYHLTENDNEKKRAEVTLRLFGESSMEGKYVFDFIMEAIDALSLGV